MFKRVTIVALVVAAFVLVMAVPALAFNGYRSDYTTSDYCSICHKAGQPGSAPKVYDQWQLTKHGEDSEAASALTSLPYGSVCAGCHTANYAPAKVTPSPSGTTYVADPGTVTGDQASGNSAASELDIGCSSCHYGAATGTAPQYGNDSNDTAHMVPYGNMADPADLRRLPFALLVHHADHRGHSGAERYRADAAHPAADGHRLPDARFAGSFALHGLEPGFARRLPQRAAPGLDAYARPGRDRRLASASSDLLAAPRRGPDRRRARYAVAADRPRRQRRSVS